MAEGSVGAVQGVDSPYIALKFRDCRLFLAGSFLSIISGKVQMVALGYELYRRTHDPMSLGWLAAALGLPMLALGLLAGQLSDMYNRKRIVVASQVLSLFTSLALVYLVSRPVIAGAHAHDVRWMYLCVLLRGIFGTFGRPARQALFPQVVPFEHFQNAVTWNSSCFQLAIVLGPALGGWVLASPAVMLPGHWMLTGVAMAFLLDAFLLADSAILTWQLELRSVATVRERPTLKSLLAGFEFVWSKKLILATITLDLFAVLLGGASYLFPVFANDILKVGPRGLGWMEAAPALGAIVMSVLLAHLPPIKRAGRAMLWAVAGFGFATVFFGLTASYPLALVALFLTGALDNISVVVRHTLVQTLAPDHMRGRISAVNSMFIGASNEMGGVESAVMAKYFSPVMSVVTGGIGTILVVGTVALFWPEVRRIGKLSDLKPDTGGSEPAPEPVLAESSVAGGA